MDALTERAIRVAVKLLTASQPRVSQGTAEAIGAQRVKVDNAVTLATGDDLVPVPRFDCSDKELVTPQSRFMGFYALRNAIRGVLIGAGYYKAGIETRRQELYGPSVTMFYTASFHLAISFLALHGRVLMSPVCSLEKATANGTAKASAGSELRSGKKSPEMVMCTLTKSGTWTVEGRRRNHRTVWREVDCVLPSGQEVIPAYVTRFLNYIGESELSMRNATVQDIPNLRHGALYEGFGTDRVAYGEIVSRQGNLTRPLANKVEQFDAFAAGMLGDVLSDITQLVTNLPMGHDLRRSLVASIYSLPFDLPTDDWLVESDHYDLFTKMVSWLLYDYSRGE